MGNILKVYAGPRAQQLLKIYGFKPELFHTVLGASGGPKWFVLAGIDRVLPEFFAHGRQPVNFVGSSAGAFRFACLTQPDPVAAINRLASDYSGTVYSDNPTIEEISEKAVNLLRRMLPEENRAYVANNKRFVPHFIVARCRGLLAPEKRVIQYPGLLASAVANAVSRRSLDLFYERYVFSGTQQALTFSDPCGLTTQHVSLTEHNIIDALLASGAIPGILKGIADIQGAGKGMYRDGGVTDYHFDLAFQGNTPEDVESQSRSEVNHELVLFPHFYSSAKPGWFDKSLPWRHPHKTSYDNIVMVVPSEEFVRQLPFGKIPDRNDFTKIPVAERLAYWQTVLTETDRLGEAFMNLQAPAVLQKVLSPLPFKTRL